MTGKWLFSHNFWTQNRLFTIHCNIMIWKTKAPWENFNKVHPLQLKGLMATLNSLFVRDFIATGFSIYNVKLIVRRPWAALRTAVIRIVRQSPYALLTAVERWPQHHKASTITTENVKLQATKKGINKLRIKKIRPRITRKPDWMKGGSGTSWSWTKDTWIFSPLLYHLS